MAIRAIPLASRSAAASELASLFISQVESRLSWIALFRARESDELPLDTELAPALLKRGCQVVYPQVISAEGDVPPSMVWVAPPLGTSWPYVFGPGARGTTNLTGNVQVIEPTQVQCVITPGLAWDHQGMRLGRGAGFYDRFFATYPKPLRVALAIDEQIVEGSLPVDPWDEPMDWVFTPTRNVYISERMRSFLQSSKPPPC